MKFPEALEQIIELLQKDYKKSSVVSVQSHCGKIVMIFDTENTRRLGIFIEMNGTIFAENTIIVGSL